MKLSTIEVSDPLCFDCDGSIVVFRDLVVSGHSTAAQGWRLEGTGSRTSINGIPSPGTSRQSRHKSGLRSNKLQNFAQDALIKCHATTFDALFVFL